MNPFVRATEDQYREFPCGGKMAEIEATANELIDLLGQPRDGSLDEKTDVEFYALNEAGDLINLWNWKDGMWNGVEFDFGARRFFSVWYSDPRVLIEFSQWLTLIRSA